MREDLYENAMLPRNDPMHSVCHHYSCLNCGMVNYIPKNAHPRKPRRLRRGNYFSQFTKKFSLGNGPPDWVQEYVITKESGKMLGTLVALSIARMPNLETFIWDMPTGILRDIWTSLSSLGDYDPPRLSKVWIRFHDNKTALEEAGLAHPIPPKHDNVLLPHSSIPLVSMPGYNKLQLSSHPTEYPNFSNLPPLKSLTVLSIDELSYLEEISVLIGRSRDMLRELRIGVASKINTSGHDDQHPVVHLFAAGSELALLLNAIHDNFDPRSDNYFYKPKPFLIESLESVPNNVKNEVSTSPHIPDPASDDDVKPGSDVTFGLSKSMSRVTFSSEIPSYAIDPALPHAEQPQELHPQTEPAPAVTDNKVSIPRRPDTRTEKSKLLLETLELEGCLLNVFVLTQSIDFANLTSLTLLHCEAADIIWAQLSRQYPSPALKQKSLVPTLPPSDPKTLRRKSTLDSLFPEPAYQLKLKRIHTDTVSSSLMTFLSKTLAPNSLEWLFLQDNPTSMTPVSISDIYRGPLRRHRVSLTKVMIDSSTGASATRPRSTSASKWMLTHEILAFIASGKMSQLRELAMVVEYKDWHFFLQQLPRIPHLRSLYVPHIVNHVYGAALNVKELAMGVVDVVTLRPEVELCYLGISTKCFEILEKKLVGRRKSGGSAEEETGGGADDDDDSAEDDYDEGEGEDEDDDDDEDDGVPTPEADSSSPTNDATADDDGNDDTASSDDEGDALGLGSGVDRLKYRLREILFYDDKVSIFKARHARL